MDNQKKTAAKLSILEQQQKVLQKKLGPSSFESYFRCGSVEWNHGVERSGVEFSGVGCWFPNYFK